MGERKREGLEMEEGRGRKETTMIIGEDLSIKYPISPPRPTHCHNRSVISVIAIMSVVTQL